MNSNELVSIIVITYNSSPFILETLESIKRQNYKNIELIISDDCSKDNTISVVNNWIEKNNKRFVETKVLESDINRGIPANCNKGLLKSKGEFIKFIAGDDILLDSCILDNTQFMNTQGNAKVIFSFIQGFIQKDGERVYENILPYENEISYTKYNSKKQFFQLCKENFITAPSVFIKNEIFDKYGFFDESIKLMEDWPMWLKITACGEKIYFMDKVTVLYRRHENSLTHKIEEEKKIFTEHYISLYQEVYRKYMEPKLSILNFFEKNSIRIKNLITNLIYENGNDMRAYNKYHILNYLDIWAIRNLLIRKLKGRLK